MQDTNAEPNEKPMLVWSSQAVLDVAAERRRQIERERWTFGHDDRHGDGSLAMAAVCYATNAATWASHGTEKMRYNYPDLSPQPPRWPWASKWWKPKSQRQDLVRAAALLLAEIERLDRREPPNVGAKAPT